MKLARRYVILQRIVWVQSLFCILLACYVMVARKKAYPLTVTVNESKPIDLRFLDGLTNSFFRSSIHAPSTPAPVAGVEVPPDGRVVVRDRLPFVFDSYCVISGIGYAVVGSRVVGVGASINGRIVDSISPLGVVVDGFFYEYKNHNGGIVKNESGT